MTALVNSLSLTFVLIGMVVFAFGTVVLVIAYLNGGRK